MDVNVFEQLSREELISADELRCVKEKDRLISVHWELRTLLYLGILLFTTGIGILLYKNIGSIGHITIITLTGLLTACCFFYCFKVSSPPSRQKVLSAGIWPDYVLLLGCLLMLAFFGYLQFQYHTFGYHWGLAAFLPMLMVFFLAYYFDHLGVLSLAIANLGLWMGISVEPLRLMRSVAFSNNNITVNGLILGALLHFLCWISVRFSFKAHFADVYRNFGSHILYLSLLSAMFHFEGMYLLWFVVLAGVVAYYYFASIAASSFYYMVITLLYGYVGLSYVMIRLAEAIHFNELVWYMILFYFMGSAAGLIALLARFNKQLRKHDSI